MALNRNCTAQTQSCSKSPERDNRRSGFDVSSNLLSKEKAKGKAKVSHAETSDNKISTPSSPKSLNSSTHTQETKVHQGPEVAWKELSTYHLYVKPRRLNITEYVEGEVARDSLDYFFEHVLPPILPEFDVDQVLEYCLKNNVLDRNNRTKNYSWKCYPLRANHRIAHETETHSKLVVKLFDTITKAALKSVKSRRLKATCYARSVGKRATWSLNGSEIVPDAHLFVDDPDDTYPKKYRGKHWYNVALSFQIAKGTKSVHDQYENTEKMLLSLHHCMVVDPCRRFTLGATIEGRRMRLWFYSRSIIICSEDFDFVAEPETMIKVALSLIFAEKADLGWDPTLSAKYDGKQRLFDIEVSGKHYKSSSTNIISETKADGIFTSATRIYKAFAEDDEEEKTPVIIKDYWPSEKYETEDVIQRIIMEDIKDPADREFLENMTLTPIASGRVKVGDQEDHTEGTILRGKGPVDKFKICLMESNNSSKSNSTVESEEGPKKEIGEENQGTTSEPTRNQRHYLHRWHYRIIFKEYAVPYHKLRNLDDMILVVMHVMKALFFIHKAGWIHRDLSPGNLYLYTNPVTGERRGLVGDLEFAKRVGNGDKCDMRTGTPGFVAVELEAQKYQFAFKDVDDKASQSPKDSDDILANTSYSISFSESEDTGVWANYLHDLESIWWIVIWTIFTFQEASFVEKKSKEYEKMREHQEYYGARLFSGGIDNLQRKEFLFDQKVTTDFMRKAPDNLLGLKAFAYTFRNILVQCYKKEESTRSDPILFKLTDRKPVHDRILDILNTRLPREKHNIRIATIQRQPEAEKVRPKRSTYDNEDEIEQPVKKRRLVQKAKKTNLARVPPGSGQAANDQPEVEVETEGMILRSGLRCRRSNVTARPRGRDNTIMARTQREGQFLLDDNRRITRSMVKAQLSVLVGTSNR